jgi:hypothetical protein
MSCEQKPEKNTYQSKYRNFLRKIGLPHSILNYKAPFEESDLGSFENITYCTMQSFVLAYGIKSAVSFLFSIAKLLKSKRKFKVLMDALFNMGNFRFGAFLSTKTFLLKMILFLIRVLRNNNDKKNFFIAGFIASYFSAFLIPQGSRKLWGCFMLSRAFDCCYNHLVKTGKIKKRWFDYGVIFNVVQVFCCYSFGYEPYLTPPSLENFYKKMTSMNANDNIMRGLWWEITRRRLTNNNIVKDEFLLN